MAKINEIEYIKQVVKVEKILEEDFAKYLARKPFSDHRCGDYLMDVAQIMNLLPPPPAKLLDVGVGSGWTSELFASRGYEVLGLDISPDMIELAETRNTGARFLVCDYETGPIPGKHDIAIIYDSLHHAEDEFLVLNNIYNALTNTGMLITVEPGIGHSTTPESISVMEKYGTTEKDMPYSHQKSLMHKSGFKEVNHYIRLSQLPIENLGTRNGALKQVRHGLTLSYGSVTGLTSIVVARKAPMAPLVTAEANIQELLLELSAIHDRFIQELPI